MLGALTILLVYQLVGEAFVQLTGLPVPGPVVGMLLLFVTLVARKGAPDTLRGTVHDLHGTPLIVTYHPAYLLRSPAEKAKAWQDLLLAVQRMAQ